MRVAWITALFVVPLASFAGCGDSSSSRSGCSKDTDCKGARICVRGTCVSADAGTNPGGPDGEVTSGGSSSSGTGGRSGGTSSGGSRAAGGGTSPSDSGSAAGGASSRGGTGTVADGSGGPECTAKDVTACQATAGLPACCTRAGTCGVTLPLLGCRATGQAPDAGNGAGGTGGGGLVSAQCSSCRATSCTSQVSACNASSKCAALSSCIDRASPFNVLGCLNGVDQPTTTLYDSLSTCASTKCTSCPSINL